MRALRWACAAAAPGAVVAEVTEVTGLRGGGNPWRITLERGGRETAVILKTGDPEDDQQLMQLDTAVAALRLAAEHALPAPRLIAADLTGTAAGELAMLMTVLDGDSIIAREPSRARLRQLGALAATVHEIPRAPTPAMPGRERALPDMDFEGWRRAVGSSPLLDRAQAAIAARPVPAWPGGTGRLVHGDLWQGNTVWSGETCSGFIDWDCAGAGHPGIDLGTLRLDAAMFADADGPAEVLAGWEERAGERARDMAYWDIAAALTTVGDMADCLPPLADHGRTDLTAHVLTARRDAFLSDALARLGNC
jgi:aminoglycoside phosphotransferase (APT) family kinase protein